MIYGDEPEKINDVQVPDIDAIKQSNNLYVYCTDNPLLYTDTNGKWIHIAIGAVVGGILGGLTSIADQYASGGKISFTKVLINVVGGAAGGALTTAGFGAFSSGVVSGVTNIVEQAYDNSWDLSKIDYVDVAKDFGLGIAGGILGNSKANANHVSKMTSNLTKKIGKALGKIKIFSGKSIGKAAKTILSSAKYFISQTASDLFEGGVAVVKSYMPTWSYKVYHKVSDWLNSRKADK